MAVEPDQPVELSYSTLTAEQVSWRREGDLLLITIHEPQVRTWVKARWWHPALFWACFALATATGARLTLGARAAYAALVGVGVLFAANVLLVAGKSVMQRRKLLIRVNDKKLLIDESFGRRRDMGDHGPWVSGTGRAWTKDEITSVRASGGSLKVKYNHRRFKSMPIYGYDPSDMAWVAQVIRDAFDIGVDRWVAERRATPVARLYGEHRQ